MHFRVSASGDVRLLAAVKTKYCYWSVSDGAYGAMMENCVRTAREAGVFREFHVLTDRALEGCECYDAFQSEKTNGLFKLHYLKVGMSRLNFDYFVWLDADTVFVRNPIDLLGAMGKSPIHVPLELNVSALREDCVWNGVSTQRLGALMSEHGILNQIYLCSSAFWIVHHDAIDLVYDLALGFWHKAKEAGIVLDVAAALGFAMQILCADSEAHLLTVHPDIWASDDLGYFEACLPNGRAWPWRHPLAHNSVTVSPAIIHTPRARKLLVSPLDAQGSELLNRAS
jgi:hypothetical protein